MIGSAHGPTVTRMFSSVLVAVAGDTDIRDALVLGAQVADGDGNVVVAHVLDTPAAPREGGGHAAASRRARLLDIGEVMYATLGPDPRVRYLVMAGIPFTNAVAGAAVRERAEAIVIGQNALGRSDVRRLIAGAPCPVAVAPYGHRFVRSFALASVAASLDGSESGRRAERLAVRVARAAGAELQIVSSPSGPELAARTPGDIDLLVIGRVADELLRQARCPVLALPATASLRPTTMVGPRR
jgi:hypothetical protein